MAAQEIQTPTLVCLHAGIQLICVLCGAYMYEYILHVYRYINIFIFYLMFSSPCVFFLWWSVHSFAMWNKRSPLGTSFVIILKFWKKNRKTIEKNVTPVLVLTYHYNMSSITRIANKGESFRKPLLS